MKHGIISRGISLTELLVGMTLSLSITITLIQSYVNASHSARTTHIKQELQNTAFHAIKLLSRHIRLTGYQGDTIKHDTFNGSSAPTRLYPCIDSDWSRQIDIALIGHNQNQAQLPCLKPGRNNGWLRGDVITVRYSDAFPTPKYSPGKLYSRTNNQKIALFRGDSRQLPENTISPPYSDRQFNSLSFYISRSGLQWCEDKKTPALTLMSRSSSGKLRRQVVVAGIEQLQFQYSTDGVNYTDADNIQNWKAIRNIKIWILVRSLCQHYKAAKTQSFAFSDINYSTHDRYRRELYSTNVSLRTPK